jgi:hypothetical protein
MSHTDVLAQKAEDLLEPVEQANTNDDDYQAHALQPRELIMEKEDSNLRIGRKIKTPSLLNLQVEYYTANKYFYVHEINSKN